MNVEDHLLLSVAGAKDLLHSEHLADPRDSARTRRVDSQQMITHPDSMALLEDPVGSVTDHRRSQMVAPLSEMALLRLELLTRLVDLRLEVKTLECVTAEETSGAVAVELEEAPLLVVEDLEIEVVKPVTI